MSSTPGEPQPRTNEAAESEGPDAESSMTDLGSTTDPSARRSQVEEPAVVASDERATPVADPDETQRIDRVPDQEPAFNQDVNSQDEATHVMPAVADTDTESARRVTRDELYARADRQGEQERLASVRAEHQAATTPPAEPQPVAAAVPVATETPAGKKKPMKFPRTTDRFLPSLGLLVLRLTVAVSLGVHGVQKLLSMDQTAQFFGTLTLFGMPLPVPSILALATGVAEVLIAVALAFGFLVRLSAVGLILISLGALLMVKMTTLPNPLASGESGFSGELELVLAGVGVLLLCVGGGAWALDRLFRRGRYSSDPEDLVA